MNKSSTRRRTDPRNAGALIAGRASLLACGIVAFSLIAPARAAAATAITPGREFLQHWKSGLAELSSYAVTTSRYGESRKAEGVMIFVYEEIDDKTRIKVESDRIPAARRVPVLKLNNVLKFNTGIYDYSVMTSVFAGLSGPGVSRPLEPRKVSFSSQEWCGQVYHQLLPGPRGVSSEIHSYFEAEGDARSLIPYPKPPAGGPGKLFYEDEMPILVRELDGEFLKPGESRALSLVPSLWERRKRHTPLAILPATLAKSAEQTLTTRAGPRQAFKWTLAFEGHAMDYYLSLIHI